MARHLLPNVLILVGAAALMTYVLVTPPPRLPMKITDGSYSSRCCGMLRLNNGIISFSNIYTTYVIESDKESAYIATRGFIGVRDGRNLEFDQSAFPLKIRLNSQTSPTQSDVPWRVDGRSYRFERQPNVP